MFECECPACKENWPLEDEIPDEVYRIPTFEQEVIYKVRHGDKKDIVKNIIELRREVEKSMSFNRFKEALVNYQSLSETLEEHLRHPHSFLLQVRSGITHCIWNLHCTQTPLPEITAEKADITAARENAKQIYSNDFKEKAEENEALNLGEEIPRDNDDGANNNDNNEQKELYEKTKQLLENSTQKFSDLKEKQEEIAKEREAAMATLQSEVENISKDETQENGSCSKSEVKVEDLLQLTDEEKEIRKKQQEYEKSLRDQQQKLREEKKKQWAAEDKERKEREEKRKQQRAKETEERIKQGKILLLNVKGTKSLHSIPTFLKHLDLF